MFLICSGKSWALNIASTHFVFRRLLKLWRHTVGPVTLQCCLTSFCFCPFVVCCILNKSFGPVFPLVSLWLHSLILVSVFFNFHNYINPFFRSVKSFKIFPILCRYFQAIFKIKILSTVINNVSYFQYQDFFCGFFFCHSHSWYLFCVITLWVAFYLILSGIL